MPAQGEESVAVAPEATPEPSQQQQQQDGEEKETLPQVALIVEKNTDADADSPIMKVNGQVITEFNPIPKVMKRGESSGSAGLGDSIRSEDLIQNPCTKICNYGNDNDQQYKTPSGKRRSQKNGEKIVLTANRQHRLSARHLQSQNSSASASSRRKSNNNNNNSSNSNSKQTSRQNSELSQSPNSNSKNNGGGAGRLLIAPIAGAWGWLQKQNEKQKQQHLKKLAEQQLQKLKQAQGTEPLNFSVVAASDDGSSDDYYYSDENNSATRTPPRESSSSRLDTSQREDEDDISWIPPVRCVEERVKKDAAPSPRQSAKGFNDSSSSILQDPTKPVPFLLTPEQMHDIARYVLPKGIAFCRWKRLYSLTRDGDSFQQCMRLCGSEAKTLLVVKTTRGALFGGYADAPWEIPAHSHGAFHGSAQACLFSFAIHDDDKNAENNDETAPQSSFNDNNDNTTIQSPKFPLHSETGIRVFHWTGANRYIQYTDTSDSRKMLAFGGGGQEGAFGLCVEQDFNLGSTGPCDTFGNLPLCPQENFHILDLEIWGFLTGQF